MVGPVLSQEMLLASRRARMHIFRWCYGGWLVLQLAFTLISYLGTLPRYREIDAGAAFAGFCNEYLLLLVGQHFFLVLIATPALVAGAVTDEKARGTLQQLLTTELRPWEILTGKLLARGGLVLSLSLTALPLLAFLGPFGGLDLGLLFTVAVATVAMVLGLGGASLLASALCRHTRDAVLGLYAVLLGLGLLAWWAGGVPGAALEALQPMQPPGADWLFDAAGRDRHLVRSALAWSALGLACLALASLVLKPAAVRQLDPVRRAPRWWRSRRPEVSAEPIRWKERHVEGVAPLAALRVLPPWLGLVLSAAAGLVSSGAILLAYVPIPVEEFWDLVYRLDLNGILEVTEQMPGAAATAFYWQGFVVMLVAGGVVGVRCSGAVTGERERGTWDSLLLTPLETREVMRGKFWGILGAATPYLVAYAVPALLLAWLAGWRGVLWTLLWIPVTALAMGFVGAAALWCSARSRTSWRSLLGTLGFVYLSAMVISCVGMPLIGFIMMFIGLMMAAFAGPGAAGGAAALAGTYNALLVSICVVLAATFLIAAWLLLRFAEKRVGWADRMRHWENEPRRRRRRSPTYLDEPAGPLLRPRR